MKLVLVMGLPGSGKTYFSDALKTRLAKSHAVERVNADEVRAAFNDWDFSIEGRLRQAKRLYDISSRIESDYVITDFVAPLQEQRDIFKADYLIWLDTIKAGRYNDTNSIFEAPVYNYRVTSRNIDKDLDNVILELTRD